MSNQNLNTLNVKTLNYTGEHIYHRGIPQLTFPIDASGAGHGGSLCLDRLGVGPTAPCPNPHYRLDVSGGTRIIGSIADVSDNSGSKGQVITATSDGWLWTDVSGTAGTNLWSEDGSGNIYYETGDVGICTNSPSAKLDVSGNVKIRGFLDMSCNRIIDVSGIYFCDASGSSITGGNSLDISSNIVYFKNNGGASPIRLDVSGSLLVGTGILSSSMSAMIGDDNTMTGDPTYGNSNFIAGHECSLNGWCGAALGRHCDVNIPLYSRGEQGVALGNYAYAGTKTGNAIAFAIGTGPDPDANPTTATNNNNKFVIDVAI